MKTIRFRSLVGISALLIAFFMLSADVMAQQQARMKKGERFGSRMSMEKGERKPGMRLKKMLNLSEDQLEKMKVLRLKNQKKSLPVKNKIGEKKARLKTLTTADKADMRAINRAIDDIAELMAKQMKSKAAHHQAIRSLLTDEQRIKFDTMKHYLGQGGKRMKHAFAASRQGQMNRCDQAPRRGYGRY
jgi:Spy/CpxP family protein refolding chaperone